MWKIAAAGIAFTLLAVCLKQIKEEYRTYLMLAAGLFFGYYLLEQIRYLIQSMNQLRQYLSIDNIYMESILKMIGITCLGEFTCDFCKDCGQEALGRQISMAARLTILGFSMPIVLAVLKNVSKLCEHNKNVLWIEGAYGKKMQAALYRIICDSVVYYSRRQFLQVGACRVIAGEIRRKRLCRRHG